MNESNLLMLLYGSAAGLLVGIMAMLLGRQEASQPQVVIAFQPENPASHSGCGGLLSVVAFFLLGVLFLMMVL